MVVLGGAASAEAAELEWNAPTVCPSQQTMEERIADAIGMPLPRSADIRFRAHVSHSRTGTFRLVLHADGPKPGQSASPRTIEGADCEQLAHTAVVVISLALDAEAGIPQEPVPPAAEAEPHRPAPSVQSGPVPSAAPPTYVDPAEAPESKPFWVGARLGTVVDWGSLPGLTPGFSANWSVGHGPAALRLFGTVSTSQETRFADGSGGVFYLWAAGLDVCGIANPAPEGHVSLCLGFEAGRLRGEGVGVLVTRDGSSGWIMPRSAVEVVSAPWLWGVRGFAEAQVGMPLIRRPFTLGGGGEVHRAEPVVFRFEVGPKIEWR